MQVKIRKYISSVLLMSMALLFTPVDFLHHLSEAHEDNVHLCHSDFCVRTFEGHCDFCDHVPPALYNWRSVEEEIIRGSEVEVQALTSLFVYTAHHLLPANKAPPLS